MKNFNKTEKVIFQIILGVVLVGLIILVVRLRPGSESISPGLPGAYPGPGETDAGDAPLLSVTEAPYPPPGQEETQMAENDKPKPPQCEFTSENPDPQISDEAEINFQFSEPRIIFSNTAGIGIANWLQDGERLLIVENNEIGKEAIKTINIETGEAVIFGERVGSGGKPVWLEQLNAVAYVTLEPDHTELLLSTAEQKEPQLIASGVTGWSLAGNDNGLVFFSTETGDIPQVWQVDTQVITAASDDLEQWEYQRFEGIATVTFPGRTFASATQPHGNTMAFYGNSWLFFVGEGGSICEVDLKTINNVPVSVLSANWSENGRYLALITSAYIPGGKLPFSYVTILDFSSGKLTQIANEAQYINDIDWINNRYLLIMGADKTEYRKGRSLSEVYLADIFNPDQSVPNSNKLFGGGTTNGWELAVSPGGNKIAVKCPLWLEEKPQVFEDHICIIDVTKNN